MLFITLIIGLSCMVSVPSGTKGVLLEWGQVKGIVHEGLHFTMPFSQTIVKVNTQIQVYSAESLSTGTTDLQEVFTSIAVNYQLDEAFVDAIYKELRNDYERRVIKPNIEESLKATTKDFEASEMITLREQVKDSFRQKLTDALAPYHITVISVMMTDFQFSEQFKAEIDRKVTAEQEAQTALRNLERIEYEARQRIIEAEANYNVTLTNAQAEALKKVIEAQAYADSLLLQKTAEAEAIQLVTSQLTEAYIEYLALMQWDGKLPYFFGGDVIPFLEVPTEPAP